MIAAAALLPRLVDSPRAQALIAAHLRQALGREARFTALSVSLLPRPAVSVRELEVAEDPAFGSAPLLRLDEARLQLRLRPLLTGRMEFGTLVLKQPAISLVQAPDGRWNVATLGVTPAEPRPAPRPRAGGGSGSGGYVALLGSRIMVEQGRVQYEARRPGPGARYRVEGLDLSVAPASGGVTFSAAGRLEPGGLTFTLADGAFGLGGARTPLDAPLRGRITVEGKDLEGLVAVAMGPEPRLGGGLKATFSLAGTAGRPVLTGEVALANVTVTETNPQCPEPRRRTLALPSVTLAAGWEDGRFTGRPLMASVAGGTVTATVIAQVDRRITVQLGDLAIRALPLERVLVDFLCHAQAVSGPLDLTGTAAFTAGDIPRTLSGAGQVKIGAGRIVGVQALRMLDAIASVAGAVGTLLGPGTPVSSSALAEFDSITGTYQARDGVLTSRDLVFNGRAVKATIAGQYNLASGALSFDVVAAVAGRNVRARVTGTAAAPSVSVVPASLLSPGDAGRIEKGLQDLLKRMR